MRKEINEKKEIISLIPAIKSGDISKEILLKKMTIGTGSNLFFRAEALKSIGGFDESFRRHQDIEVLVRFCQKYKILNINKILVVKDNGNRINKPKKVEELLKVKENYMNSFRSFVENFPEKERNQFYFVHFLEILYLIMANGEFNKYKMIKEMVKKYGKFTIKIKLKLIRYGVYKFLKIDRIREKFDNKKNRKMIDKTILKEIDEINIVKEG